MAGISTHISGTASVNAGEVNVVGQGSTWASSGLKEGDQFWAAGLSVRIASVQDNTHLTLAFPWPGASRGAANYEVRFAGDIERAGGRQQAFLDKLAGNLFSIADLDSDANTLPFFIGKGVASLLDFPAAARSFIANFFTPVQQGGGAGMANNKVRIGWNGLSLLGQADQLALGKFWMANEAVASIGVTGSSGYQRLPSGLLFQWLTFPVTNGDLTVTFPIAFTESILALVGTVVGNDADPSGGVSYAVRADGRSLTGFNARARYQISGGSVAPAVVTVVFIAIGK